jgi:capsular polysaccharide biosynthesis protein
MDKNTSVAPHEVLLARVSDNLAGGDYNSVIGAIPQIMRLGSYAQLVPPVIKAALALNTIEAIESAVGLAIACDSNEQQRAEHALLLASGGRMTEAFVVLFADPQIQWFPSHTQLIAPVLKLIGRSMNAALPAARAAERLRVHLQKVSLTPKDSRDLIPTLRFRSRYGFSGSIKSLPTKFVGPPTKSFISDPSLVTQQEDFVRGLLQGESKILSYRIPAVFELQDVFINRHGDLWKKDGTILKKAVESRAMLPNVAPSIQSIDTLIAVCGNEISKNPYLWFARTLPSLAWRWDLGDSDIPIGISDRAKSWVAESIRMASKEPPTIISVADAVFVKRLILCNTSMYFLGRHEAYQACFERIFQRVEASGIDANTEPFYISRRDSKRRSMANELALEEALAARGVKPIVLTGLSFAEKVSLFRKAPLVVGAHGAGFGNLVFAKPGRQVVEILPIHTPFTHHRVNIPNVSRIMGHEHYHYLALPTKAYDDDSWEINVSKFLEFFDQNFG